MHIPKTILEKLILKFNLIPSPPKKVMYITCCDKVETLDIDRIQQFVSEDIELSILVQKILEYTLQRFTVRLADGFMASVEYITSGKEDG